VTPAARICEPDDITVASSDHNHDDVRLPATLWPGTGGVGAPSPVPPWGLGGTRTGGLQYESSANAADTLVLGEVVTR
jgi:hypothetical protein